MRERDDFAYLTNAGMWPRWPLCPLKNHNEEIKKEVNETTGMPAHGIVFDQVPLTDPGKGKATPRVYILNMFMGWTPEEFDNCKKFEYASIEEMLAAGWMVD